MTVDLSTARWFSESLLQLYAAATEAEIDQAVARAQARLQRIPPDVLPAPRQAQLAACLQRIVQQAGADWRARINTAERSAGWPDGL